MSAHNNLQARVLELVRQKPGLDKEAITKALACNGRNVKQALYRLRLAGKLHQAGVERFWCYYLTAEDAQANHARLVAETESRRQVQELKQIRQANLRRKAARQAEGKKTVHNRPAHAVQCTLLPGQSLAPDVRITIAPTPKCRFAPDPWTVGQITKDWLQRTGKTE